MESIEKLIKEKLSGEVLGKLGKEVGADKDKTSSMVDMALPMILGGLGRNVEDKAGAGW